MNHEFLYAQPIQIALPLMAYIQLVREAEKEIFMVCDAEGKRTITPPLTERAANEFYRMMHDGGFRRLK